MRELHLRAAAIVYRRQAGLIEYLLVTSKNTPTLWIVPQGHLEPGETFAEAAVREAREEAGAEVHVERSLGKFALTFNGRAQTTEFFLAHWQATHPDHEPRAQCWATWEQTAALHLLPETRQLLATVHPTLTGAAA